MLEVEQMKTPKPIQTEKDQAGFGIIAIVLIIVAVLAIGATGALVYRSKHQSSQDSQSSNPCPPGQTYGYPMLPNATQKVCLNPNNLDEPVIYLYPTHPERVGVKLSYAAGLSKSVPAYNAQTGWNVLAQPDGSLTNLADAKPYPYLLWEGNPPPISFDMTKGFVVSGSQTKAFFEGQLPSMGLSQKETDTFIAYWLPRMQGNRYNLIHFAGSEYTDYAKLTITPNPNSLLRVFMAFEPLQAPVKVSPQSFPAFHRVGFTAVEWGGTELH